MSKMLTHLELLNLIINFHEQQEDETFSLEYMQTWQVQIASTFIL